MSLRSWRNLPPRLTGLPGPSQLMKGWPSPQQRALPRTRGPDDHHLLGRAHVEADVLQHFKVPEPFAHAAQGDHRPVRPALTVRALAAAGLRGHR